MAEKKTKKPMSEEQLERLALARKKANEMRKVNQAKRLQTKMDNLKYNPDGSLKQSKEQLEEKEVKENVEEEQLKEPEVPEKEEVEEKPQMTITKTNSEGIQEEEEVIIKKKPPKKKKQTIIVEQSEDDSDEFESNQNVLFVKRISKKKEVKLPEPPPQQEYIPPPVRREPPPIPRKTKNELIYDNMFSGQFLNNPMNRRF